jgi:tetratricopeptide (TPR) repeat protein
MSNESGTADYKQALNASAQFLQQNQPDEALDVLAAYMERLPHDADLAINVGGAYILQRKWDKAVAVLKKAAEATPDNVMLWINLAAAELGPLETAGPKQQERAIAAFEKALKVNPQAPNVHYSLGLIHKERGELMRASAFFQRAVEVNPVDNDARYWLKRIDAILAETNVRPKSSDTETRDTETRDTESDDV